MKKPDSKFKLTANFITVYFHGSTESRSSLCTQYRVSKKTDTIEIQTSIIAILKFVNNVKQNLMV